MMDAMTTNEVRQKFLEFFREKGHAVIPSAPLVPDDKTVLFVTAGMQPLVPYLMGERKHPQGARLANSQKCLRTDDILEVGDNRHLTFFEMLGNWSLGDPSEPDASPTGSSARPGHSDGFRRGIGRAGYFKKESIAWSFELLTSKKWFGIDPEKLYVTVFEGDATMGIARDDESIGYWKEAFKTAGIDASLENGRISAYPKKKNWWELAGSGPCGPDTEIFYDMGKEHDPVFGEQCHANCDCGRFVEIWNNVFMEYEKKADGPPVGGGGYSYVPLAQKNVDTGMGLERITMVLQGVETVFEIDVFKKIIGSIETKKVPYEKEARRYRIIADHLRAAVFLISDGVAPSNVERGYILRSLLRRAIAQARILNLPLRDFPVKPIERTREYYKENYRLSALPAIIDIVKKEFDAFLTAFEKGRKEVLRIVGKIPEGGVIPARDAFNLHQTYGFRIELMIDLAKDSGHTVDEKGFWEEYKKHQEISRAGSEKKFGGHGLMLQTGELKAADEEELKKVTRLHTATHLLQAALRRVLGDHVHQMGSDITAERLRFDFSHPQKMTDEEKKKVEEVVNKEIQKGHAMTHKEMPIDEAEKTGALMFQKEKYGKTVKVYSAGDFSKELCGGPHVANTKEVGTFKILKEEASSAGVRRIRATVVD